MSQCGSELHDRCRWWQVHNYFHLSGINQDLVATNYMAQSYTKWCAKYAFSQIQCNLILVTPFQYHAQILNMVSYQTKDRLVIKVYFKKLMNEIFKSRNYYSRENSRGVFKAKENYRVLVESPFYYKGFLVVVLLRNSDLMVARESVCK